MGNPSCMLVCHVSLVRPHACSGIRVPPDLEEGGTRGSAATATEHVTGGACHMITSCSARAYQNKNRNIKNRTSRQTQPGIGHIHVGKEKRRGVGGGAHALCSPILGLVLCDLTVGMQVVNVDRRSAFGGWRRSSRGWWTRHTRRHTTKNFVESNCCNQFFRFSEGRQVGCSGYGGIMHSELRQNPLPCRV